MARDGSTKKKWTSKDFAEYLLSGQHAVLLHNRPAQKPLFLRTSAAVRPAPFTPSEGPAVPDESSQIQALITEIIRSGLQSAVPGPKRKESKIIVVGAGAAGLATAYELKRAGMDVLILEASHRIGGRVKTFRDPVFAPGLHAEGGAMRLPKDHFAVHEYLKRFGKDDRLEPFEQTNKVIYLSGYGETLLYRDFNQKLIDRDERLLDLFPHLKESEKGKTVDQLWTEAVKPVYARFNEVYDPTRPETLHAAYQAVFAEYDKYSLDSYFREVAQWSDDCVRLYDLGSAHVVLDNGFIESWKDSFLSSNDQGQAAGMQQMKEGMDAVLNMFLDGVNSDKSDGLIDNIRFGADVRGADLDKTTGEVTVNYVTTNGDAVKETGDFVVFTVPLPVMRLMTFDPPFSPDKNTAVRTVRYVEVTKILLQFKTRWWEQAAV